MSSGRTSNFSSGTDTWGTQVYSTSVDISSSVKHNFTGTIEFTFCPLEGQAIIFIGKMTGGVFREGQRVYCPVVPPDIVLANSPKSFTRKGYIIEGKRGEEIDKNKRGKLAKMLPIF